MKIDPAAIPPETLLLQDKETLEALGVRPLTQKPKQKAQNGDYTVRSTYRELDKSEHDVQKEFFTWLARHAASYPELDEFFAVPNGGRRDKRTAARLAMEGVKAGIPDVLALIPRRQATGLALEFKVKYNQPTEEQKRWLGRLMLRGISTHVVYSLRDAQEAVVEYLGLGRELIDL